MMRTGTYVAIATTLTASALVSLWGCGGAGASKAQRVSADSVAKAAPAQRARQAPRGFPGDTMESSATRPTPSTNTYSYNSTTYFPTYYPTAPKTMSDGSTMPTRPTNTTTSPSRPTAPTTSGPTSQPRGPIRVDNLKKLWDGADRRAPAWLPQPGEELWVIERPAAQPIAHDPGDDPGQGQLWGVSPDGKRIPAPLEHTDVKARIQGHVGTVQVTQRYRNPFLTKIEAVYVFPLPTMAAVSEFVMHIGQRRIRGIIREKAEAKRIYREARNAGHVASLMTQERPNIFQQKVANIEPGKRIDIAITYFETLDYRDGWYEWAFPMVVGPRFNPSGHTQGVGAEGYGGNGGGQPVGVTYMTKREDRTGHDIGLAVELDTGAGVDIEELSCRTHAIRTRRASESRATVTLHKLDSIPNKDFVLRWRVAGERLKTTLTTQANGSGGGWFTLTLYPPRALSDAARRPMELVFVLDCSGSMRGVPIHKAKQAIIRALRRLQPRDTLQVIRFSNDASQLGPRPLAATPRNVQRAIAYVNSLNSTGGTMMIEGIKAALGFQSDRTRQRVVSFMTDGYIGNEQQIFHEVHRRLGNTRLFSFGVGSSPNRFLLEGLARMGRGAVAWVGLDRETGGAAVDGFYERISHPALANVRLDFGDWRVTDVFPRVLPELYVGRPITVVGRYQGTPGEPITLTGRTGRQARRFAVTPSVARHPGISKVWARLKIADLFSQHAVQPRNRAGLETLIADTALEYDLLSQWTAFVAVDATRRTNGTWGTTVKQPTPLPEGMTPPGAGGAKDD